jgi:GNAT superfamily N-acetyltransferase
MSENLTLGSLEFYVYPVRGSKVWPYFAEYHYLSDVYRGHHAFIAVRGSEPVAFSSIMAFPSGSFKNAWREHRTVVLPQFQGLGLGARLSDWTAHFVCATLTDGQGRYFSKTVHPRLGEYRENSPLWTPTSKNKKKRTERERAGGHKGHHLVERKSYSHEYIGHRIHNEENQTQ